MLDGAGDTVRVLVVGTGLGTNAALGLEVPLPHGKWVTDGAGGVVEVTAEERSRRYNIGATKGFMGEEFRYIWECEDGYLGNAGFLYAALLLDSSLQVDIVEHPFTEMDREAVLAACTPTCSRVELVMRLDAEKTAMWSQDHADSYAQSILRMLGRKQYAVVIAGSKGVYQLVHALTSCTGCLKVSNRLGLLLINGAEEAPAFDGAPSLETVAGQLVGHPCVHRLVVSSHSEWASASLRRQVVKASIRGDVSNQLVAVYAAKDVRSVPNRETHALPWSLIFPEECWHSGFGKPPRLASSAGWKATQLTTARSARRRPLMSLILWAASQIDGKELLEGIPQFPGPARLAEVRVEVAELRNGTSNTPASSSYCFQAIRLCQMENSTAGAEQSKSFRHAGSQRGRSSEPIYDILFDAQQEVLQVVLLEIASGTRVALQDIIAEEGQMATRLVRFFRCYDEKSKELAHAVTQAEVAFSTGAKEALSTCRDDVEKLASVMLEELCGLNKNFGNFLWTSLMAVATAHTPTKRFGNDQIEVIVELELVRLRAAYLGFSHGAVNSEHVVAGVASPYGDALDDFLLHQIEANGTPAVREIEGYTRRDFTAAGRVRNHALRPLLQQAIYEQGLVGVPQYGFDDCGHSTGFRFFSDGKAWLSTGACAEDFRHVQSLAKQVAAAAGNPGMKGMAMKILIEHESISKLTAGEFPGYQSLPKELLLSDFLDRNGYRVMAYRRLGNAGAQWYGSDGWEHFADSWRGAANMAKPLHFCRHGPAQLKSRIFGFVDRFPADIGRGGTDAKVYFYDSCIKASGDRRKLAVHAAVNRNVLSWWEPQLYAISVSDIDAEAVQTLPGVHPQSESLSYCSEGERLLWSLRTVLDVELGRARNLWLAGLQKDGLSRRDRPFPDFGSLRDEDAQLSDWVAALVRANIQEQDQQAIHQPSYSNMGPTTARRVASTGTFDWNAKCAFLDNFFPAPQSLASRTVLFKQEVVQAMRSSLRSCPLLAGRPLREVLSASAATRQMYLPACQLQGGAYKEEAGCHALCQFMCSRVAEYNLFKDLQEEVNALLQALDACS